MYLSWNKTTITDFSEANINSLYNQGFVFTRIAKGVMNQTRSLRVDLRKFKLSSENRRILKKTDGLSITSCQLPFTNYHWQIGKMAKDFYETKFGKGIFSANKIKTLLTSDKSNFNRLFIYSVSLRGPPEGDEAIPLLSEPTKLAQPNHGIASVTTLPRNGTSTVGYCIALETNEILHYCYPFYQLSDFRSQTSQDIQKSSVRSPIANLGLGMMLRAILWAQEVGKKYIYLGSATRPSDTYKLQFEGVEWYSEKGWSQDLSKVKKLLTS